MQDSLRNATVVVTSAASGLGRAAALAFARQGARVVLAGPHAEALAVVVAQCQRLGAPALAVPVDAADAASARLLARAARAFGGQIDLWVDGSVGRPPAANGDRKWLTAALVAGLAGAAAGFFAWRKRKREEDYSYFGHGAQL